MTECFETILARYGQEVTVMTDTNNLTVRAFLQPVTEQKKTLPFTVTSLGTVDDRLWIYLGRTALKFGDAVNCGASAYTVRNSAAIQIGDELSHYWAVLEKTGEAAK